ncbi:VOC family protein [Glycomyces sp. YM15]|uniref:VOC family protein n=1 Tax=Glycomyces sp. YM15 TaxID=2800446 RepID=UPI001962A966|nr:VOC family protein [Glycomyces sp. YM15]
MAADSSADITDLHHVGLVVRDMNAAITAFTRFGFHIGAPAYPALPSARGAAPEPVGAGNTHADFPRSFIELLAFAPERREHLPAGSRLVPLHVPEEQLAVTRTAIRHTIAGLAARLDISEGAHILVFATRDAERTAIRLEQAGVARTEIRTLQRPITTAGGTKLAAIKVLEFSDVDPAMPAGMVPEGRVGAAEDVPNDLLDAQVGLAHPNGATGLAECVLCVDDGELDSAGERYERYLNLPASLEGATLSFALGSSRLILTNPAGLAALLPGERPHTTPGLSAYTVEVADLAAAEAHLRAQNVELRRSVDGRPFIPAKVAFGAALILQQANGASAERRPPSEMSVVSLRR